MGFFSLGILTSLQFAWWDVCASPMRSYNKVKVWRDKILDTVNYLQSESAKWKALFTTLKAPYSLLRGMGLNPQMAATFLFAGAVATTGVVAAEVMEGRSFSRVTQGITQHQLWVEY